MITYFHNLQVLSLLPVREKERERECVCVCVCVYICVRICEYMYLQKKRGRESMCASTSFHYIQCTCTVFDKF